MSNRKIHDDWISHQSRVNESKSRFSSDGMNQLRDRTEQDYQLNATFVNNSEQILRRDGSTSSPDRRHVIDVSDIELCKSNSFSENAVLEESEEADLHEKKKPFFKVELCSDKLLENTFRLMYDPILDPNPSKQGPPSYRHYKETDGLTSDPRLPSDQLQFRIAQLSHCSFLYEPGQSVGPPPPSSLLLRGLASSVTKSYLQARVEAIFLHHPKTPYGNEDDVEADRLLNVDVAQDPVTGGCLGVAVLTYNSWQCAARAHSALFGRKLAETDHQPLVVSLNYNGRIIEDMVSAKMSSRAPIKLQSPSPAIKLEKSTVAKTLDICPRHDLPGLLAQFTVMPQHWLVDDVRRAFSRFHPVHIFSNDSLSGWCIHFETTQQASLALSSMIGTRLYGRQLNNLSLLPSESDSRTESFSSYNAWHSKVINLVHNALLETLLKDYWQTVIIPKVRNLLASRAECSDFVLLRKQQRQSMIHTSSIAPSHDSDVLEAMIRQKALLPRIQKHLDDMSSSNASPLPLRDSANKHSSAKRRATRLVIESEEDEAEIEEEEEKEESSDEDFEAEKSLKATLKTSDSDTSNEASLTLAPHNSMPIPATFDGGCYPNPHKAGCARAAGYYKIDAALKVSYLHAAALTKDGQWNDHNAVAVATKQRIALLDKNNKANVSSRESRANHRRLLLRLEQTTNSDLLKFNALKTRKKRLRFAKSTIHDWGLFALEPIDSNDLVIEYIGEIIRQKVADHREKLYEKRGIGSSYLFRIDDDTVIDATLQGNVARFINHSCDPNCNAKVITVDAERKIVIYAKRPISEGEEITYDYKFPREQNKIVCLCGAVNCRGTLN